MDITVNPEVLWNIILTSFILPLGFLVRSILGEQKSEIREHTIQGHACNFQFPSWGKWE